MPFRPRFSELVRIENGRGLHSLRPWRNFDAHRRADSSCAGTDELFSQPKSESLQLASLRTKSYGQSGKRTANKAGEGLANKYSAI